MTSIVSMDSAGRIAVPNQVRKRKRLTAGSKFLITELPDGRIILSPLDIEQLAKRLQKEMKDIDIDGEVERVQQELEKIAERWYPETAARLKKRR